MNKCVLDVLEQDRVISKAQAYNGQQYRPVRARDLKQLSKVVKRIYRAMMLELEKSGGRPLKNMRTSVSKTSSVTDAFYCQTSAGSKPAVD